MKIYKLSLLTLLLSLVSCGAYFEDKDNGSSVVTPPAPATGTATLVYQDTSVNNAQVTVQTDSAGDQIFVLEILGGVFPPGSYNGGGTGSKALLGIDNFNDQPLADFDSVEFTSQSSSSVPASSILYINIVVDIYCDGNRIKILAADPEFTTTPVATFPDGYSTYRINSADDEFLASGGIYHTEPCDNNADYDCTDPGEAPAVAIIEPVNPGVGPYHSIDDLLAYYPNACIKSTLTGDGGMPAGVTTSGFMFAVGSSSSTNTADAQLKNIYFNDVLYEF